MLKNIASQYIFIFARDIIADSPKTDDAGNITVNITGDNGALGASSNSVSELDSTNAPGIYKLALTQAETNANSIVFTGLSTTAGVEIIPLIIQTQTDRVILANSADHGGPDAVMTLRNMILNYPTGTALSISGGNAPSEHTEPAVLITSNSGRGLLIEVDDEDQTAVHIKSDNGNGMVIEVVADTYNALKLMSLIGNKDIDAKEIDAIITAIGTPANIDGGGATLAANLVKMAGANFEEALHSLLKIRQRGDVAWNTGVGTVASKSYLADSTDLIEGDEDAGDDTKINIFDGDYWSIGETNSGTFLEVNIGFIADSGLENPVSVEMWLQYDGGGTHHLDVKASNPNDSTYETIGEIPKTSEIVHLSFTLHPNHINTSTGAIIIKLIHSGGSNINHVLHIDKIIVMTATASIVEQNIAAILNDTETSGVKVASDGLDNISITPAADIATSNFRQMMVAIYRRFFKKVTASNTKLRTYADNGSTILSEQDVTEAATDIVDEATTP